MAAVEMIHFISLIFNTFKLTNINLFNLFAPFQNNIIPSNYLTFLTSIPQVVDQYFRSVCVCVCVCVRACVCIYMCV